MMSLDFLSIDAQEWFKEVSKRNKKFVVERGLDF